MAYENSIRAVNLLIRSHVDHHNNDGDVHSPANLVQTRFAAKFEEPRADTATSRRNAAWERWIMFDGGLRLPGVIGPNWAKARLLIHEILSDFRMGDLVFTNGSSFEPLGPRTSLACKLTGVWTITADCFDLFAKYSYWHRALKHAVKKRFASYCKTQARTQKAYNRILWERFRKYPDYAYQIYKFKLFCVVKFVRGNRFSTVPKNNLKDRAICLEPLCNMLVQRAIGLGIRTCLLDKLGIDLDTLAEKHRYRISDSSTATIDLSDCSDAISVKLIQYLLPKRVLNKVLASRSEMTLGLDDNYYIINKVSSMGNGFTFDLMTLVITALTRSFDVTSTVFGDDIICQASVANDVIENLQVAGFVVNRSKTNIGVGYRESCGAHFVDGYGYLVSFDIKWIQTLHDLIVTCNKVAVLSAVHGEPYETLRAAIWSCVPQTLLGATSSRLDVNTGRPPSFDLDTYIRYGPKFYFDPKRGSLRSIRSKLKKLHKSGRISVALAVTSRLKPARNLLRSGDWDIFFQYIRDSRLTPKIPRSTLKTSLVARVDEEQIGFVNALLP